MQTEKERQHLDKALSLSTLIRRIHTKQNQLQLEFYPVLCLLLPPILHLTPLRVAATSSHGPDSSWKCQAIAFSAGISHHFIKKF